MKDEIRQWLDSGAEVQEGLRLLSLVAPNKHLAKLVSLNPKRYKPLLIQSLASVIEPATNSSPVRPSFREDWPFLSDCDCPNELKILVADKITTHRRYVEAHEKLYDCTTPDECFSVAKNLIENYIENRKIHSELAYYKAHRKILGKHPIFEEVKRCNELRHLPISSLFRRKENLEEAIWRINSEIRKGNKPHLLPRREQRLAAKQRELSEVNRIIDNYASVRH